MKIIIKFSEFLNESEDGNIGMLDKHDSLERKAKWQKNNQKTELKIGDYMKIAFSNEDKTEWMWVSLTSIKGNEMEGILDNDPIVVKNVKLGDKIKFKREDIAEHLKENEQLN